MTAPQPRPGPPADASTLRLGYGTNGFANHRLDDALAVIADLGYVGVALTLDHDHLDPFAPGLTRRTAAVSRRLSALGLAVVIETGARYLLDPWHKHAPTLLHDDPTRRIEFLRRAVRIGADLGAEAVSFWAGVRPDPVPAQTAWDRLVSGCAAVVDAADAADVTLGFEPEPGMLVEDIAGWRRLRAALGAPARFGITLDIGHCRCLEPWPVPQCVAEVAGHLVNVQIDDMRRGCTSTWSSAPARSTSRRCWRPWPRPVTAGWSPSSCPGTRTPRPPWPPGRSSSCAPPRRAAAPRTRCPPAPSALRQRTRQPWSPIRAVAVVWVEAARRVCVGHLRSSTREETG